MVECNLAKVEVAGSNPVSRSIFVMPHCCVTREHRLGGNNSTVECQLPKLKVAGSNPVSRSRLSGPCFQGLFFCSRSALPCLSLLVRDTPHAAPRLQRIPPPAAVPEQDSFQTCMQGTTCPPAPERSGPSCRGSCVESSVLCLQPTRMLSPASGPACGRHRAHQPVSSQHAKKAARKGAAPDTSLTASLRKKAAYWPARER